MSRTPSKTFTEKELEIMRVICGSSEATAREIQARLPGERHYNSVLTIIRVLERKGHLAHRVEGKAHVYRTRQQPDTSRRRVLSHLACRANSRGSCCGTDYANAKIPFAAGT